MGGGCRGCEQKEMAPWCVPILQEVEDGRGSGPLSCQHKYKNVEMKEDANFLFENMQNTMTKTKAICILVLNPI